MKNHRKNILVSFLLILLVSLPLTALSTESAHQNRTTVEMRRQGTVLSTGDTFSVNVADDGSVLFQRVDVKISYDPASLTCLSIKPVRNPACFRNLTTNIQQASGTLTFRATASPGEKISDDRGEFCTLTFLPLTSGETELAWRCFGTSVAEGCGPRTRFALRPLTLDISENKETISPDHIPDAFDLSQNYPNPFNPETHISYQIPAPGHVRIAVFNILGQEIRTVIDEDQPPGYFTMLWDGKDNTGHDVSSGMYFYRMESGSFVKTRRMTLLR